ncbi:MAG: choice-of-anchor tandem repeat GloVer-containing protein [Candidatus Korobacteraceae bacterium]|jgi:uncharacterized repeat protein (TIGR03803 family)
MLQGFAKHNGKAMLRAVAAVVLVLVLVVGIAHRTQAQSTTQAKATPSASRLANPKAKSEKPGTVLFSNLGPPTDPYNCCTGWTVAGSGALGTSFTNGNLLVIPGSGSSNISQIDLGLTYASGANTFDVTIWKDNNGVPGAQVPNACFLGVLGVSYPNLLSISGISQVSMTAGQSYFMVIGPDDLSSDTFGAWNWNNQGVNTLDIYSTDGGVSWNSNGNGPMGAMDIQGDAAPAYDVIYNFTGGLDGAVPLGALTIDKAGNFYGTASSAGASGNGTVFKLTRTGSGWTLTTLYSFKGGMDGSKPSGKLVIGVDGILYGTTINGGGSGCSGTGCGTVFNVKPGATAIWKETVLYAFSGGSDGANPTLGELTFDKAGNLYGTTYAGGKYSNGVVFELTHSGGTWTESVLYPFTGGFDGGSPQAGVIFDQSGNLYGTTVGGGSGNYGTVYQLTPTGSGWTENVIYNFAPGAGGVYPFAGLVFDAVGNLYGASSVGIPFGTNGGAVFELTPFMGTWVFSVLYQIPPLGTEEGPFDSLLIDAAGNLYGTTLGDGSAFGEGNVFKLASGSWTPTDYHDFSHYCGDGGAPYARVVMDSKGVLYGTLSDGGTGAGAIFTVTP